MDGRVPRSGDPFGIEQELWATLALYQALRTVMVDAVESRPGTDPDRAGFTTALATARTQVVLAAETTPDASGLPGTIGRTVLADLLPARRPRVSARKVKSPISRYHTYKGQARPRTSTPVTTIQITIHDRTSTPNTEARSPAAPAADDPGEQRPTTTPEHEPTPQRQTVADPGGRRALTLAVLRSRPDHRWHARDVARHLGITNFNSFRVQMSQRAQHGLIRKTGPATYTLAC
jgi:hypothetical protein